MAYSACCKFELKFTQVLFLFYCIFFSLKNDSNVPNNEIVKENMCSIVRTD